MDGDGGGELVEADDEIPGHGNNDVDPVLVADAVGGPFDHPDEGQRHPVAGLHRPKALGVGDEPLLDARQPLRQQLGDQHLVEARRQRVGHGRSVVTGAACRRRFSLGRSPSDVEGERQDREDDRGGEHHPQPGGHLSGPHLLLVLESGDPMLDPAQLVAQAFDLDAGGRFPGHGPDGSQLAWAGTAVSPIAMALCIGRRDSPVQHPIRCGPGTTPLGNSCHSPFLGSAVTTTSKKGHAMSTPSRLRRVAARPIQILAATKVRDDDTGEPMIAVGVGPSIAETEFLVMTIADARALRFSLDEALVAPPPPRLP